MYYSDVVAIAQNRCIHLWHAATKVCFATAETLLVSESFEEVE
jgi:hypothetical protein